MAIVFVSKVAAASANGQDVTSATFDSTGANFLAVNMGSYAQVARPAISDNKSNTNWQYLTDNGVGGDGRTTICYHVNPTVGTGHTITVAGVASCSPSFAGACFSGVHVTAPFDQENGSNVSPGTAVSTGSVTPTEANELIIASLVIDPATSIIINSSMTITDTIAYSPGNCFGVSFARLVHTTGAINPQWSWTGSVPANASIATFKVAAATDTLLALGLGALSLTGRQAVVSAVGPNTAHIIIRPS